MSKSLHLAALCGTLALMSACSSLDHYVYHSRVDRPTTITLYDPLQDKALWVKDIPVGNHLEIDLDRQGEDEIASVNTERAATKMSWWMYGPDSDIDPIESSEVNLAGTPVIIKVSYRPSPEYPADFAQTAQPIQPSTITVPQSPAAQPAASPSPSPAPSAAESIELPLD